MRITDLPARDRPRERLAALGVGALADRELLAILLGTGGSHGVGAHALAERLLARFGSVSAIGRAHPAELAGITGIGPAKAAALVAAFELARRATIGEPPTTVSSAAALAAVAAPLLHGRTRERLVVVICDRAHRLLGCEVLAEGSADQALLPLREVAVAVLRRDGAAFGIAHNHPSGDPTPSPPDLAATLRMQQAAAAVGLHFLDHVVVTDTDWRPVRPRRRTSTTTADNDLPVSRTLATRQGVRGILRASLSRRGAPNLRGNC